MASMASRVRLAANESDRLVNRLKNTNVDKFHTLCKMHLSFLLHLPGSSLNDFLSDGGATWGSGALTPAEKSKFRHFGKKKTTKENKPADLLPITQETIDQVLPLIDYLNNEQNIKQEGLFRKSGHIGRQKLLREKLQNGEDVRLELESGIYSAHDCASVLKAFLSDLQEPVLTEKHYLAHCQIPEMDQDTKQLQTLQLLVQLLPAENLFLLQCLLLLLQKVAEESENKMTSETLGTLFAPHLLVPRKMSASELQAVAGDLTKTVAFMIDNAKEIFKLPQPLIRDIATYWSQMEESETVTTDDRLDSARLRYRTRTNPTDVPIHTSVTFTDRQASQQAATKTDTQMALAQLYAHVSSMPESAKKRRLLKQFNKANGVSLGSSPAPSDKHKRTKSFGDSIKKIVGRNHRRRGSSHSLQIQQELHNLDNTPFSSSGKYTLCTSQSSHMEHTPVIKRSHITSCNTPCMTPVMKLFTNDLHDSVLSSNQRVHIVDMKENRDPDTPINMTRKRKCASVEAQLPSTPYSALCRANGIRSSIRSLPNHSRLMMKPVTIIDDQENIENIPIEQLSKRKLCPKGFKSPPIKATHDRRFERPVAFISPITRTINKASLAVQTNVMTPGSRAPMAMFQTP